MDLGDTYGRIGGEDQAPERIYLALEEHYHTRLLAYVLDMFSLPFRVVVPPLVMRQFVKMENVLPERFGFPFVGAAEMAGCIMFDELRRIGVELFADEPDVAARIHLLYTEILTDEIGHVGYCAARCSSPERTLMRWLYPYFGRLFARQTVEISLLTDREKLRAPSRPAFDVDELTIGMSNETFLAAYP